jgi:Dynamin family
MLLVIPPASERNVLVSEDLDGGSGAFNDVIATIVALAEQGSQLSLLTDDEDGWRDALARVDRLRDPSFLIAVCGEFSSGKSVLLGALMRRPEQFPDGVGATTAVPTIVRWEKAERILIRTLDRQDGFTISPADLAQYVTEQGNPRN